MNQSVKVNEDLTETNLHVECSTVNGSETIYYNDFPSLFDNISFDSSTLGTKTLSFTFNGIDLSLEYRVISQEEFDTPTGVSVNNIKRIYLENEPFEPFNATVYYVNNQSKELMISSVDNFNTSLGQHSVAVNIDGYEYNYEYRYITELEANTITNMWLLELELVYAINLNNLLPTYWIYKEYGYGYRMEEIPLTIDMLSDLPLLDTTNQYYGLTFEYCNQEMTFNLSVENVRTTYRWYKDGMEMESLKIYEDEKIGHLELRVDYFTESTGRVFMFYENDRLIIDKTSFDMSIGDHIKTFTIDGVVYESPYTVYGISTLSVNLNVHTSNPFGYIFQGDEVEIEVYDATIFYTDFTSRNLWDAMSLFEITIDTSNVGMFSTIEVIYNGNTYLISYNYEVKANGFDPSCNCITNLRIMGIQKETFSVGEIVDLSSAFAQDEEYVIFFMDNWNREYYITLDELLTNENIVLEINTEFSGQNCAILWYYGSNVQTDYFYSVI